VVEKVYGLEQTRHTRTPLSLLTRTVEKRAPPFSDVYCAYGADDQHSPSDLVFSWKTCGASLATGSAGKALLLLRHTRRFCCVIIVSAPKRCCCRLALASERERASWRIFRTQPLVADLPHVVLPGTSSINSDTGWTRLPVAEKLIPKSRSKKTVERRTLRASCTCIASGKLLSTAKKRSNYSAREDACDPCKQ